MKKIYLTAVLFSLPIIAFAAASGLVPCGGEGQEPCQFCHSVELVVLVMDWLVKVLAIIAAIVIVVMGLRLVSSVGDASAKGQAKRVIANVVIGYIILLTAWFFVDFGLKLLVNATVYGKWNGDVIECVVQPNVIQTSARPSADSANNKAFDSTDVSTKVTAINSSGTLKTDIENAARSAGISDPDKIKTLQALISQESSNCANKVGPDTRFGTAYGCGQMLVSTARGLDPNLARLTDEEVAAKLTGDDDGNAYNLTLSAKYYNQLLNKYAGEDSTKLALAAYNGGFTANQPSVDCPGIKKWECVWDSPGCYNTGKTDCKVNEGPNSYAQTRNYVSNITAVAAEL